MRILLFLIVFLPLFGCGGVSIEDKLPLPENFEKLYRVEQEDDISYNYDGLKILRLAYKITIPPYNYITKQHIIDNCRHLVRDVHDRTGVRDISILIYNTESELNGPYTVALYEFCPYGDWSRTNECYSTTNQFYDEHIEMKNK